MQPFLQRMREVHIEHETTSHIIIPSSNMQSCSLCKKNKGDSRKFTVLAHVPRLLLLFSRIVKVGKIQPSLKLRDVAKNSHFHNCEFYSQFAIPIVIFCKDMRMFYCLQNAILILFIHYLIKLDLIKLQGTFGSRFYYRTLHKN